jgi:hypothetical protein
MFGKRFIIGSCPKHCIHTADPKLRWGGMTFGCSPKIHNSLAEAKSEARRLLGENPEKAFVVFQAIEAVEIMSNPVRVTEFK